MRIEYGPVSTAGSVRYLEAAMTELGRRRAGQALVVPFARRPTEAADVVVWSKRTDGLLRYAAAGRPLGHVFFSPVDSFRSVSEARDFLSAVDGLRCVVAPSATWFEEVRPESRCTWIPHPVLHFDGREHPRNPDGDILCVAASAYADDVRDWLARVDPPRAVRILASEPHLFRGRPQDIVREWTPALHAKWQNRCAAAVDVKSDSFWHRTKPSTKAMEMVAAGLPVAVHPASAAHGELAALGRRHGIPPIPLEDSERLLSDEAWRQAAVLRDECLEQYGAGAVAERWWRTLNA